MTCVEGLNKQIYFVEVTMVTDIKSILSYVRNIFICDAVLKIFECKSKICLLFIQFHICCLLSAIFQKKLKLLN